MARGEIGHLRGRRRDRMRARREHEKWAPPCCSYDQTGQNLGVDNRFLFMCLVIGAAVGLIKYIVTPEAFEADLQIRWPGISDRCAEHLAATEPWLDMCIVLAFGLGALKTRDKVCAVGFDMLGD